MNLNLERKIKFWLGTVSKVLIVALILFQLKPYVFGGKEENDTLENLSKEKQVEPESHKENNVVLDGKSKDKLQKNRGASSTTSQPEDDISDKDLQKDNKNVATKKVPNSVSLYIYDGNELDLQTINRLENTVFFDFQTLASNGQATKTSLMNGQFSAVGSAEKVCVGTISYDFKNDGTKTTCTITLTYNTYETATGAKIKDLSKSLVRYGIGFSETQAKDVALKKL